MGSGVSTQKLEGFPEPFFLITYLPPKTKGLVYSETHHVYVNDLARAESLPRPSAPPTRKREMFSPGDLVGVDKRTDKHINTNLRRPINELVNDLTGFLDDDLYKVRALYRWLTSQPVMTSEYVESDYKITMHQLWNLQRGKITYAFFFGILCWLAKIPCVIVRGLIKGSTYVVGQKMSHDRHVGEWNAVLIGKHWRLVDTFWGSSTIPDSEEDAQDAAFYDTSESYFLTDPGQFIYSHCPDEEAWQLLGDDAKTLQQFEAMAVLNDRFFTFEMELLSHVESTIETDDGNVNISFKLHPNKSIHQAFICIPSSMTETSKHCIDHDVQVTGDCVSLKIDDAGDSRVLTVNTRFVDPGVYKLDIVGRELTNFNQQMLCDWVAVYKVIFNRKTDIDSAPIIPDEPVVHAVQFKPCTELNELGLVSIDHPHNVAEITPGKLTLQYAIIDSEKIADVQIHAHLLSVHQSGDSGKGNSSLDSQPSSTAFVKEGDVFKAVMKIGKGHFEVRVAYKTTDGREYVICNHELFSLSPAPALKPTRDDHKVMEMIAVKSNVSNCSKAGPNKESAIKMHQPREIAEVKQNKETHTTMSVVSCVNSQVTDIHIEKIQHTIPGSSCSPNDTTVLDETNNTFILKEDIMSQTKRETVQLEQRDGAYSLKSIDTFRDETAKRVQSKHKSTKSESADAPKITNKTVSKKPVRTLVMGSTNKLLKSNKKTNLGQNVTKLYRPSTKLSNATYKSNVTGPTVVHKPSKSNKVKKPGEKLVEKPANQKELRAIKIPTAICSPNENSKESNSDANTANKLAEKNVPIVKMKKNKIVLSDRGSDTTEISCMSNSTAKSVPIDSKVVQKKNRIILSDRYSDATATPRMGNRFGIETQTEDPDDLRKRLVAATESQNVGKLFRAIRDTLASGHVTMLSPEVTEARELLMRLRRLQEVLKQVMALSHRALSEIRSYAHPKPAIHRVMQATLLLLGHAEEETKDWSDVRNIIGRTGKLSLMRRIQDLQTRDIDASVAERSRHLLEGLNKDDLGQYSVGAAIFYTWAVEVSNGEQYRQ